MLVALMAALVPAGLAPLAQRDGSCCSPQCPMPGNPNNMEKHCQGSGMGHSHQAASCTCSMSPDPGSGVPLTAFRFSFNLASASPLMPLAAQFVHRTFASPAPLNGYVSPLDQPPRA